MMHCEKKPKERKGAPRVTERKKEVQRGTERDLRHDTKLHFLSFLRSEMDPLSKVFCHEVDSGSVSADYTPASATWKFHLQVYVPTIPLRKAMHKEESTKKPRIFAPQRRISRIYSAPKATRNQKLYNIMTN